jgi:hypothetical protein
MNSKMTSIRSVLIRTSMSNIQKEISQLEHWLTNLSDDAEPTIPTAPFHTNGDRDQLVHISRVIDRLSEDVNNQQFALNNILNRLDILEGFPRPEREVFIDQHKRNDPWMDDDLQPLQNEIIGAEDDISEPLYNIYKKGVSVESSVGTPSIIPDVPEDRSLPPDIDSDDDDDGEKTTSPPITIRIPAHTVETAVEEAEEAEVEEEEEEEVVEEEEEEEEEEVVEEEAEEEEEEEEEEGLELEEIEYKGGRYYKDAENFIYSINAEDEPSENPVGYWKEKTAVIAFYRNM